MAQIDIYSNLSLISIELGNELWKSTEHYFQAKKFNDAEIINEIRNEKSPYRVACLGQTRKYPMRNDWDIVKNEVMEMAIRARFIQWPEYSFQLKNSIGILYDRTAVDDYWGIGMNKRGKNITGKILMVIRNEIRSND